MQDMKKQILAGNTSYLASSKYLADLQKIQNTATQYSINSTILNQLHDFVEAGATGALPTFPPDFLSPTIAPITSSTPLATIQKPNAFLHILPYDNANYAYSGLWIVLLNYILFAAFSGFYLQKSRKKELKMVVNKDSKTAIVGTIAAVSGIILGDAWANAPEGWYWLNTQGLATAAAMLLCCVIVLGFRWELFCAIFVRKKDKTSEP
jgi:hypothetical protein